MEYEQLHLALHILGIILLLYLILRSTEYLKTAQGQDITSVLGPGYFDSGMTNQHIYTSGATMRRLGQKFSSTNQGEYMVLHNVENPELQGLRVMVTPMSE